MWFRKVFGYCSNCIVWVTVFLAILSFLLDHPGVTAQRNDMVFESDKEVVTSKVMVDDKSEKMVGSASNVDRAYSSRVKIFDDIFNIPITVLQQVNNLIQGIFTSPGQSIMAASGFNGKSLDLKEEKDVKP